jgi:hypothetical protein
MRPRTILVPRSFWVSAAAVVVAGLAAAPAGGYPYTVPSPAVITGASPFSGCGIGATPGSVAYTNAEVEPQVGVDPVSGRAVAVWQQDRWSDGSARALGAAVSADGGLSWASPFFLPWSLCAGGAPPAGGFPRVTDPWVSFGPDGIGYQVALASNPNFPFDAETAITASRSLDAGVSWESPQVILRERFASAPFPINDKDSVTADPTRPSYAYAVWDRVRFPSEQQALPGAFHSFFEARSFRGDAMLSRTTDGGASWERARSIMPTNANLFTFGNQVAVTGDRALVDVFEFSKGSGTQPSDQHGFGALRSTDAGQTWSRVIEIAADQSVPVRDPDDGDPVRATPESPDVASDLRLPGTLYAVWADGRFSAGLRSEILFTKSTDGGLSWSMPIHVNQTPATANPLNGQAFLPTIAVSADGTIALAYDDFRFNTSDPDTLQTAAFLAHSHDGGATWEETQISAPFDLETAPLSDRGYFIGDYIGLAADTRDFVAVFPSTNNGSLGDRTDVVAARIQAP